MYETGLYIVAYEELLYHLLKMLDEPMITLQNNLNVHTTKCKKESIR